MLLVGRLGLEHGYFHLLALQWDPLSHLALSCVLRGVRGGDAALPQHPWAPWWELPEDLNVALGLLGRCQGSPQVEELCVCLVQTLWGSLCRVLFVISPSVVQALRLTLQPVQPVALTPFSATRNEATLSEFWIIPILNKSCELFLNFELFKFWINPVKFFLNFELFCIFWIILELLKFWIFPVNYFWILKYSNFE